MTVLNDIKQKVKDDQENIINLMREIVAISSMDGQLKEVGERIGCEMTRLGFEEVRFDRMGNIMGRIAKEENAGAVEYLVSSPIFYNLIGGSYA